MCIIRKKRNTVFLDLHRGAITDKGFPPMMENSHQRFSFRFLPVHYISEAFCDKITNTLRRDNMANSMTDFVAQMGFEDIKFEEMPLEDEQVINESLTRVAVCLCLDTSGSMEGSRIKALQEGLNHFKEDLRKDIHAFEAADLSIVTFDNVATIRLPFTPMKYVQMPKLIAGGMTQLGEGVLLALEQLENRKNYYKQKGISYSRPLLFIMSDGFDNGNRQKYSEAKQKIHEYTVQKKVTAFGINVDDSSAIQQLTELTGQQAVRLDSRNYAKFFEWLSNSVGAKSTAAPNSAIVLPPPNWIG